MTSLKKTLIVAIAVLGLGVLLSLPTSADDGDKNAPAKKKKPTEANKETPRKQPKARRDGDRKRRPEARGEGDRRRRPEARGAVSYTHLRAHET